MKKLMILGLSLASAMVVNASNWKWASDTGKLWNGSAEGSVIEEGNAVAYLFDVGTFTQQQLLTAVQDSTLADVWAESGVKTAPSLTINDNGKFDLSDSFEYGTAGEFYKFYMAVVSSEVNGYVFISDLMEDAVQASAIPTPVEFGMESMTAPSKEKFTGATFGDAGWYQTVPEPTSGLLLLLGVAGLALRRRRA